MFAMLSYAVFQGGRTSQSDLTKDQAKLIAQEIVAYSNSVATATSQIRLRGYSDTQVSFQGAISPTNFTNPNCTDDGCKIFSVLGGKVTPQKPPPKSNDGSDYFFPNRLRVDGIGTGTGGAAVTSHVDLLMILPNVNLEVCKQINILVGSGSLATNPPKDTVDAIYVGNPFVGVYSSSPGTIGHAGFRGFSTACFEGAGTPAPGTYHFYRVLIAR